MPIPQPKPEEQKRKFVSRCMSDSVMLKEYPDSKKRAAICISKASAELKSTSIASSVINILSVVIEDELGFEEKLTFSNFVIPEEKDYIDFDIEEEAGEFSYEDTGLAKFQYEHPVTKEIYNFNRKGTYKKNGRYLLYVGKASGAEYQGKKVKLGKPFRTPSGPKKFSVYVKNDKGNIVKVNFGDPNMKIKKNIPERRKSFRARHNCDNPGPKWKARYWSCRAW